MQRSAVSHQQDTSFVATGHTRSTQQQQQGLNRALQVAGGPFQELAAARNPAGCLSPALLLPSLCPSQLHVVSFWVSCCCCGETDQAAAACGGRTATLVCAQPEGAATHMVCLGLVETRCPVLYLDCP